MKVSKQKIPGSLANSRTDVAPSMTSVNIKHQLYYGIKVAYPALSFHDIKIILENPEELAVDTLYKGLSCIYAGHR